MLGLCSMVSVSGDTAWAQRAEGKEWCAVKGGKDPE